MPKNKKASPVMVRLFAPRVELKQRYFNAIHFLDNGLLQVISG